MKSGKISAEGFKNLFNNRFGYSTNQELISPGFGKDVSILDIGKEKVMISASDPLSFVPSLGAKKSAELSIHLVANDIVTTSVAPQFFQMVLNLNENFEEKVFNDYWQHLHNLCKELKISIVGGHTGVIPGQQSTVIGGGTMFSVENKNNIVFCDNAKEGDVLLLSKKAAISSTAILGLHFKETAKEILGENSNDYFERLFSDISVFKEGILAGEFNKNHTSHPIHAMHDVTEGGVLGAVYEMCTANHLGVIINEESIPIDKEQQEICKKFNLNPLEIIGAGSMLMSVSEEMADSIINFYKTHEIELTAIGSFKKQEDEKKVIDKKGKIKALIYLEKDPYWDAFFSAYSKGWK